MESNSTPDELIEKYLDNSLSPAERQLFDEKLESDPGFAKEYKARLLVQDVWVRETKRKESKQHIGSIMNLEKRATKTRRNLWLAAASVLLIAGLGALLLYLPGKLSEQKTLADNKHKVDSAAQDVAVQGYQNVADEFASVDSVTKNDLSLSPLVKPADSSVFKLSDTIRLSWPATAKPITLRISNKTAKQYIITSMPAGSDHYTLLPHSFKPGTYTWQVTPGNINRSFTVH